MVQIINLRDCQDWGKPGDIRIDRTTKWGNPYKLTDGYSRDKACDLYEIWLDGQLKLKNLDLNDLKNVKRIGCWCYPLRCHGNYIKKLLEKSIPQQQSLNL
jgi:hypothetical protein